MWRRKHDDASAQAIVTGVTAHGGEAGSAGTIYFDLELEARLEDGSKHDARWRVGGPFAGTELRFVVGDIVPVRYDRGDLSSIKVDEDAMNADVSSRRDAFDAARLRGAEMQLDAQAAEAGHPAAPSDAELQSLSDRWGAAMDKARVCMDAHEAAKAAGNADEARRQLADGALANAEQVQLGEQFKRLRKQRPDWQPAST